MKKELYNLDQYEDILTKEQMRIVCHISKRKAMYLLQSGLIPCINTGKKTHTYLIKKTDIENYLRDREVNPWRYAVSYPKQASATDRSRIKKYYNKISRKTPRHLSYIAEMLRLYA